MRCKWLWFFIILFTSSAFAQANVNPTMSFSPPATDLSIIYLSNIFGVVDGVLSGSGSQIFGRMMGVFNAAVLAMGSMVIMYTLIVGTLNTAQEGEFLGRQWSSIWIPVRCTTGLSLLIPKASGYSLIQIGIMWVVVQGVGAADKIWNSALDYLNQGGKIIQAQMSSSTAFSSDTSSGTPIYMGASKMLTGQVCMYALQKNIENIRASYIEQAQSENPSGPCSENDKNYPNWAVICNTNVPEFLSSVNFIDAQNAQSSASEYAVSMPNFGADVPEFYSKLNGICGTIKWNDLTASNGGALQTDAIKSSFNMTDKDISAIRQSRAIALQQMYDTLSNTASQMVNNDPQINKTLTTNTAQDASMVASAQFGVALNQNLTACQEWNSQCSTWGPVNNTGSGVLLNGSEFSMAILNYNSLMSPVLNLMSQYQNQKKATSLRSFIRKSEQDGWIFAGTYFFNLISLSGSPSSGSNQMDKSSGLDKSLSYNLDVSCDEEVAPVNSLCWFLKGSGVDSNTQILKNILALIDGSSPMSGVEICPTILGFSSYDNYKGYVAPIDALNTTSCSSTVLGYIGNSYFLAIPGQPGISAPKAPQLKIKNYDLTSLKVHMSKSAPCGKVKVGPFQFCLGRPILSGLLTVVEGMVNGLVVALQTVAAWVFQIMVVIPLQIIVWPTLESAFKIITTPGVNPIVNLANMGNHMIESTLLGYLQILGISVLGSIPYVGVLVQTIFTFAIPIYAAWLMFFVGIGFMTAYYVPLLPYMIFLFGTIAWLMSVIEAMVAGPILALGMMSPEGEGIMGKSEQGFMLLVNIFLRPSMMIIGFVTAIALTYVGVWILNYGFGTAAEFLITTNVAGINAENYMLSQIMGHAFYIFIFISLYMTIVQKSFTLIYLLPDKVLRWIGGPQENMGSETQQWLEEGKSKASELGGKSMEASEKGGAQLTDQLATMATSEKSEKSQGSVQSGE